MAGFQLRIDGSFLFKLAGQRIRTLDRPSGITLFKKGNQVDVFRQKDLGNVVLVHIHQRNLQEVFFPFGQFGIHRKTTISFGTCKGG